MIDTTSVFGAILVVIGSLINLNADAKKSLIKGK